MGASNNNTITNNNVLNNKWGILLESSSNNSITNNTASNNTYHGIYLVYSSNNNTLTNNTVLNNTGSTISSGIYLGWSSNNNTLTSNIAANNTAAGISLGSSNNNTLTENTASKNYDGIYLSSSSNNSITNNIASNNTNDGIHLDNACNYNSITNNIASNNIRGIYLESSNYNTVTNNTASNNTHSGIYLHSSSNNTITDNTATSNNYDGIYLHYLSNYNTIANNNASYNTYGIELDDSSSNNRIYNNYFNSMKNAFDNGNNIWNITKTNGTNIIGGSWLGGNYWSDYTGIDTTGDGLGDTLLPYNSSGGIVNGGDWLPLVFGVPDTTPPASITNLKNVTGQTWINWTWSNPPDTDFNYTAVYLDGVWQRNTSDPVYNATGLTPDTYYEMSTHTVDLVGNVNTTWVNQTTRTIPSNTPPTVVDDAYSVDEDTILSIPAPGVLGNDVDVDGDVLTAVKVSDPNNGAVTLNTDGSFTYLPNANFNGLDSFTYKANDGKLDSNVATVTITVNPVNDAPVASDDAGTTDEDMALTIDVLANDGDVDNDPLAITEVSDPPTVELW